MNRRAGRLGHVSDEDEKYIPDYEDEDVNSHHSSEEENDYLNQGSASGPGKILEDDIKYYLDRVTYIADANPQEIVEREKSIKETLLGLLQNLSDLKLFARNSKQFMKLVKPKAEDRANSDVNAAAVWPEVEQANNATYAAENDPRYTQLAQIIEQARTRHERDSLQESRKQQREAGAARSSQRRSGAAGDEDVTMGQEEGPRVCPITKRAPEQPVRNRLCGHVYDRAGVEHYMRGSRNPTCPMTGCMNRKRLEPEQLEDVEQSGACATDTPHRA